LSNFFLLLTRPLVSQSKLCFLPPYMASYNYLKKISFKIGIEEGEKKYFYSDKNLKFSLIRPML